MQLAVAIQAFDDFDHVFGRNLERVERFDQRLELRRRIAARVERHEMAGGGRCSAALPFARPPVSITMFLCVITTAPISMSPLITTLPARSLITTRATACGSSIGRLSTCDTNDTGRSRYCEGMMHFDVLLIQGPGHFAVRV